MCKIDFCLNNYSSKARTPWSIKLLRQSRIHVVFIENSCNIHVDPFMNEILMKENIYATKLQTKSEQHFRANLKYM